MPTETITVGEFTINGQEVEGPADYMRDAGIAYLKQMTTRGTPAYACLSAALMHHPTHCIHTAMLVTLQTNFAAWNGMRVFNQLRGAS